MTSAEAKAAGKRICDDRSKDSHCNGIEDYLALVLTQTMRKKCKSAFSGKLKKYILTFLFKPEPTAHFVSKSIFVLIFRVVYCKLVKMRIILMVIAST